NTQVRQAMSLAIDRKALVKDLFSGQAAEMNGMIPQGEFAYDPTRPTYPYDPTKAKDLLKQANYKNEPVHVECRKSETAVMETITSMWKAVGINADLAVLEPAVRSQKIAQKKIAGALWYGAGSLIGDPDGIFYAWLGKGAVSYYWSNDEYDKLVAEAHVSLD